MEGVRVVFKQPKKLLLIAEKPSVGERIAHFLASHFNTQETRQIFQLNGDRTEYYEIEAENLTIFVVSLAGHLVQPELRRKGDYPKFDWYLKTPTRGINKVRWGLLKQLAKEVDIVIGATDNDEEGEVMLYYTITALDNEIRPEELPRMRFLEVTETEVVNSFYRALDGAKLNMDLVNAGHWRHLADLWYGKNISNLFSKGAIKHGASQNIKFSIGRVKIPLLRYLIQEDIEIMKDVRISEYDVKKEGEEEPKYIVKVNLDFYGQREVEEIEVEGEKLSETLREEWRAEVSDYEDYEKESAPRREVYNYDDIVRRAIEKKVSPEKIDTILENLYIFGYISYPRTDSRKLNPRRNYNEIVERLASSVNWINPDDFEDFFTLTELHSKDVEGHAGIYPTGIVPSETLSPSYRLVWELITRKFLSALAKPAKEKIREVKIKVYRKGQEYSEVGVEFKDVDYLGYLKYMEIYEMYQELPDITVGEEVRVVFEVETRETRYGIERQRFINTKVNEIEKTPVDWLFNYMVSYNLGTVATRLQHINILRKWNYVEGEESLSLTGIGHRIAELLRKHVSVDVYTTSTLHDRVDRLKSGDDLEQRLKELKEEVRKIYDAVDVDGLGRELNDLGECRICGAKMRLVVFDKGNTVEYAVGCTNYPECKYAVLVG